MSHPQSWLNQPPEKRRTMPFFPHFLLRDIFLWFVILNVLAGLAVFFPAHLGLKADPFASAPAGIKPEWYFMFMFQTLKIIPAHVLFIEGEVLGILAFAAGGLIWMIIPFIKIEDKPNSRFDMTKWIGIVLVVYIIVLTVIGYISSANAAG